MEFPNGYIGKEPGRLVIGDGATSYDSLNYATSATNVFQPFITDPSIYIPRFANTATSTGSGSVNSGMASIEKMGNGSSTSTVTLPTIVSAVKEALVYHANSITKLNNDLGNKANSSTLSNYTPLSTFNSSTASLNTAINNKVSTSTFNSATSTLQTNINGKANSNHTHSQYSTTSHNHDSVYAKKLGTTFTNFYIGTDNYFYTDAGYLLIKMHFSAGDVFYKFDKDGIYLSGKKITNS
jgi:hypothetical protein